MNDVKDTKGYFQLRGIISNLTGNAKNFGYESGTLEKGNSAGKQYKKIRFNVETSNQNKIPVELFGCEKDYAYLYNKETKKTQRVSWSNRFSTNIQGFSLILPEFDLIEKIKTDFKDGDSVFVNGEFQFSEYTNAAGQKANQTRYIIKSVHSTNSILTKENFNDADFKEENSFVQEIIVESVEDVVSENKIFINAYTKDYKGLHNVSFVIDKNKANSNMQRNFKTLRIGDFIKVLGVINHQVEKIEVDNGDWGKAEPIINVNKSLEIQGANAESLEKRRYTEEDLTTIQPDDLVEENVLGFSLNT